MSKSYFYLLFILSALNFCGCSQISSKENQLESKPDSVVTENQGLIGAWYHGSDLTRIGANMMLKNLDATWDVFTGRGSSWSAQWEGYITAPATGTISFFAESNREMIVKISGKEVLNVDEGSPKDSTTVNMVKGLQYHINVIYLQKTGGVAHFRVLWSWKKKAKQPVPAEALRFSAQQAQWWNYVEKPEVSSFDFSSLKTVPVENYLAYCEAGRFAGWPANNGVWAWGNEILFGFELGHHKTDVSGGHSINEDMPHANVLSRSLDGGKTWVLETPANFIDSEIDEPEFYKKSPGINFTHPDFAMRVGGNRYFVSYNRGKTWEGPYKININEKGEKIGKLTSRTDYIVLGPDKCIIFFSAETGVVESDYQDRSFCVITNDGGKSFDFLGWMTHNTEVRSVMSSTVKIEENYLVTVMRRKHEQSFGGRPTQVENWIEASESKDNGKTWTNLGKVANTDLGERNGNPPAMVKLDDGRLCVAYGYREFPYGIRMKVSNDYGKSWGDEFVVRADGATWDLGYPRMVMNADGKIVIIYYFTTKENYAQHIAVSIIDPINLVNNN